jgi:hypothetical protein
MTDRSTPPNEVDATLDADLESWFQGEVRQAAADLRRAPLRPSRARVVTGRGVAGPAVAAALVVTLIVAGISRLPAFGGPAAEPSSTFGPTVPPTTIDPTTSTLPSPSPAFGGVIGDRYQDGIPAFIDGELVRRQGKVGGSSFPDDGSSFLVGGWLQHPEAIRSCVTSAALEPCPNPVLASTPLEDPDALPVHLSFTFQDPVDAVVLRVHRDDPRADDCEPARIEICRAVLVAEAVLWSDDEQIRTAPISTRHALNRLRFLVPELTVMERAIDPRRFDPASSCDPGFPRQTWTTPGLRIAQVLVFPSVAAREAVDDNFNASGFRGTYPRDNGPCSVTTDSFFSHEWVVVHNVMVALQVDVAGATAAQAKLIDEVRASLQQGCSSILCPFGPPQVVEPPPSPPSVMVGRYADGIPQVIGTESVLRPSSVGSLWPEDGRTFLVGGWTFEFLQASISCPHPVGLLCVDPFLAETPIPSRSGPRVSLAGWTSAIPAGPVVLRVHVKEPLESECHSATLDGCPWAAVIDQVVWAGDDTTTTAPSTPTDTMLRLILALPAFENASLSAIGPRLPAGPAETIPLPSGITVSGGLSCGDPYPQESWWAVGADITYVLVFPSIDARIAADLGPERGVGECPYLIDEGFRREWVAVANVMLGVRVGLDGKTRAQAALLDAVRAFLEAP